MVRLALLAVVLVFIVAVGGLTVRDMVDNGVTWLDAVAALILLLFATGIVGALLHPPED